MELVVNVFMTSHITDVGLPEIRMAEVIIKDNCPECDTVNYVNDGDPMDCSGVDIDGMQCHKCGRIWLWGDNDPDGVLQDLGLMDNVNIERGKPTA